MPGLSQKDLVWVCRTLGTMLDAGVPISRVLDVLAGMAHSPGVRRALAAVRARLDQGATLAEALGEQRAFPPLFVSLIGAGEHSGTLERTAAELARYYEFRRRIRSRFIAQIALPVIQYVLAVAVVSFALHFVRVLSDEPSNLITWLCLGYGIPPALYAIYWLAARVLGGARLCHELLLRLPVLGSVARTLALARFSLILYLLYEAAFPIMDALRRALEGTGNPAFAARARVAVETIERSGNLTDALTATGLFPREYLEVTAIAEESGKLSERLDWLASHYAERAEGAVSMLASFVAKVIWAGVAIFMIICIFRLFARYLAGIQGAMP